jgi:uncharacterized glyoxalase superfamily protein PhnB
MNDLRFAAPLLLVDDLSRAVSFYAEKLGFDCQFVYDGFYAAVARDQSVIHLKCAAKTVADRSNRQQNGHLDVYIEVGDAAVLHRELTDRRAPITQPLTTQPWQTVDFQVTDPDGYVLCFSSNQVES